ncbi:MAG TPA: response regulator, partial [Desulfuromonadales bacterium]|nr:response regulator [Desulfuromonadales bacterium]
GGILTIETRNIHVAESYTARQADSRPGEYVMLTVSDNGRGMDPAVRDRIFEPFFTTKGPGKGTGLGLATVYGIVKQNEGFVHVYSEPGEGTSLKIYLPKTSAEFSEEAEKTQTELPSASGETVMIVEDEASILQLGKNILEALGYQVFALGKPEEALTLGDKKLRQIDLLLTDVIMPNMNGRELFAELRKTHPELKAVFMSGYPADVIADRGVLQEGLNFQPKPFSIQDLAEKIRESLDRK